MGKTLLSLNNTLIRYNYIGMGSWINSKQYKQPRTFKSWCILEQFNTLLRLFIYVSDLGSRIRSTFAKLKKAFHIENSPAEIFRFVTITFVNFPIQNVNIF